MASLNFIVIALNFLIVFIYLNFRKEPFFIISKNRGLSHTLKKVFCYLNHGWWIIGLMCVFIYLSDSVARSLYSDSSYGYAVIVHAGIIVADILCIGVNLLISRLSLPEQKTIKISGKPTGDQHDRNNCLYFIVCSPGTVCCCT